MPSSNGSRLVASLIATAFVSAPVAATPFSAADVYRAAAPSVVMVYAKLSKSQLSTGTGSLVSADGYVLTNRHVISGKHGPGDQIFVFFKPERLTGDSKIDLRDGVRARVVSHDADLDLALLKVDRVPAHIRALEFADSEQVEIGTSVAAIGHPGGGGLWTLTTGTVSSSRKEGNLQVFQTDTAINPGNSGGPLLDADANLIGVNTYMVRVGDDGLPLEGLNYSLRSNFVRSWLSANGVPVRTGLQVTKASEVAAPAAAPPPAPAPPPPATEPEAAVEARPFEGPNGEDMYGVEDPDLDHERLRKDLYGSVVDKADHAFSELDAVME